ncbi:MAG: LUD domain-containing protein [Dehalococcoidia bacterium]|nr:LUD domain-containing protein [Dehalococcoidia bacterium]MDD5494526.1 LUD domain-containing protein [Dehalococcoidia bacterium]
MAAGIKKRIKNALADNNLQTALGRLAVLTKGGRRMGMKGIDFEVLRNDLHDRKEKSIANLPHLIQQFKENAAAAGAIVYEAGDAREANEYVLRLARQHGVRHIVKSKSMLTEEIGLKEHLEQAGIHVVETDIGERIVQLAGERPAHIVGPAIHKTVDQIAELLSRVTGNEIGTGSQELLDTIRDSLRQSYLDAEMGISGANICIAETGTLVIVTNEGNGQIVTTLSPLHVAIVGMEKLMGGLEDANAVLHLLSRCCVGPRLTVYTSFITGTGSAGDIGGIPLCGGQGPRELHIVLVDNGRSELRNSPEFRKALYCIKCGACLNICPVFASVAGQVYGHIYQGGIGTILTAFFHDPQRAHELSEMCMGCLACRTVCPSGIDIPRLIRNLKARKVRKHGFPLLKRVAYRGILKSPSRTESAARALAKLQQPFLDADYMIRKLPYPLGNLTDTISLPGINSSLLAGRMRSHQTPETGTKAKVAFFAGCVTAYAYPDLGDAVFKLLDECDTAPYYPAGQACCGAPAYFSGDSSTGLTLARHNIESLLLMEPDYVVTVCPGCAAMLKNEYPLLTSGDAALHKSALKLGAKVRDLSQLLIELGSESAEKATGGEIVTYHDPCHLKRGLGVFTEPRKLIEKAGYELVEMNDPDACCGFGGDALLTHPELCGSILKRKLDNIEATGVNTVVTACTACVLQLRGGLDRRKSPIKVVHIAEFLAKESTK